MELETLLELERETILGEWCDLISRTYPPVTSEFLTKQGDQFRNPLGHAIVESAGRIYDEIRSAMDTDRLLRALDGIIRIRAVQNFTPSKAVSFIFDLKPVIRRVMDAEAQGGATPADLVDIDSRIDRVALLAFEKYMICREKLFEIRNNELKNRVARVMQGVGPVADTSEEERGTVCDEV
jgi:hypothetical protein